MLEAGEQQLQLSLDTTHALHEHSIVEAMGRSVKVHKSQSRPMLECSMKRRLTLLRREPEDMRC